MIAGAARRCAALAQRTDARHAKKELVAEAAASLQQPGIEQVARGLVEQPADADDAGGRPGRCSGRSPADKREAIGKQIEADVKKYVDEADAAACASARSSSRRRRSAPILEEKFSEDELKQLIAWLESPVNKKYQQIGPEMQNAFVQKLVADARPLSTRSCRRSSEGAQHARPAAARRRAAASGAAAAAPAVGSADASDAAAPAMADAAAASPTPELLGTARPHRRGRPRAARAAEPARRAGAAGRRAQEARRLGGVPPRARSPGDRRPEGASTPARCRPTASRRSGARSCRPAARSKRRRAWPTSARPAPSASWPRSASSARRSCACPAPASTRCSAPPAPARPTSASCRSRTPPKAWSRARSTCSSRRRCSSSARPACSCATTCCAATNTLDGIAGGLRPSAGAGAMPRLAQQPPARCRAPAGVEQRRRRAPGQRSIRRSAAHRQRARGERVRPARGGAGDPGRPAQPHPLRDRHPPASATRSRSASGHDCTSLVVSVANRPGAVHDMLVPLKQHGVSMTPLRVAPGALGPVGVLLLHRPAGPPRPARRSPRR